MFEFFLLTEGWMRDEVTAYLAMEECALGENPQHEPAPVEVYQGTCRLAHREVQMTTVVYPREWTATQCIRSSLAGVEHARRGRWLSCSQLLQEFWTWKLYNVH